CSGVSSALMPPWGNCQASWLMRRAQSTCPTSLVRMMPTLGRKPSESITADHLTKLVVGIVPQKPMAPKAKPDADFRLQWHAVSRYALRPFGSRTEVSGGPGPFRSGQYPAG